MQLYAAGNVESLRFQCCGFLRLPLCFQNLRFTQQIFEALLDLYRAVLPLHRLIQVGIAVEQPVRRLIITSPCEPAGIAKLVLNAAQHDGIHVRRYAEGHGHLFPAQSDGHGIRLGVVEGIGQRLRKLSGMRLHRHAQVRQRRMGRPAVRLDRERRLSRCPDQSLFRRRGYRLSLLDHQSGTV